LWELLVTDGHVRAVRFRAVAVPLVVAGIILVLLSAPPGGLIFRSFEPPNLTGLGADFQRRASEPVIRLFQSATPLSVAPDDFKTLAPASELPEVIRDIQKGLSATGSPPTTLPIKDATAADFWAFNWPYTKIMHLQVDDIQVFGAVVAPSASQYSPFPAVRWLGVFRTVDGKWQYTTVVYPYAFIAVPGMPTIQVETAPITMRKIMGFEEFKP
jgi:hypothetical protein